MRKFSSTNLKVRFGPSGWTPKVRRGPSTILLKFWITVPLKLRNLNVNLRWGPRRSEVDWGAWTGWNWHQVVWEHWPEGAPSSSNWTGEEEVFDSHVSALFLQVTFRDCCMVIDTVGHCSWWPDDFPSDKQEVWPP